MEYKTEEEFLKNYDITQFKQLSMTTDIILLSVSDEAEKNYRKNSRKKMSILLVKRNTYPYKDKWCLPGGFLNPDTETLEDCAKRVLKEETNLKDIYIEQLYTFDNLNRDPRTRTISAGYIALVDKNKLKDKVNKNASWFDISIHEETENKIETVLSNGQIQIPFTLKKTLKDKTTQIYEYEVIDNKYLAFDHAIQIETALERIKNKINYTDIVFNMMPKYFTLGELQKVYEVILDKKLLDPAFRRIIAGKVKKTNKILTGKGHRPSVLFEYNKDK